MFSWGFFCIFDCSGLFDNKLQQKGCEQHREQLNSPTKRKQEMSSDTKPLSTQSKNTICLLRENQNSKGFLRKVRGIKGLQQVLTHKVASMSVQKNCKQPRLDLESEGVDPLLSVICNGFWPPVQVETILTSCKEAKAPQ